MRLTRTSLFTQCLALYLVAGMASGAVGAPADVALSAPSASSVRGADHEVVAPGSTSVSTQTGAFEYGYPIAVPPGRFGVQPSLSLVYSSSAGIYGGVAAGWSLPIGEIRRDPIPAPDDLEARDAGTDETHWTSSMAGGQRLIRVADQVWGTGWNNGFYRAQHDASYGRYRFSSGGSWHRWDLQTPDGMTYYFGSGNHMTDAESLTADRFPLTKSVDRFGNSIDYQWEKVSWRGRVVDYRIAAIEYTYNVAADLGGAGRVEFEYAPLSTCGGGYDWDLPIGPGSSRN